MASPRSDAAKPKPSIARVKGGRRAAKATAARSDRFAFVTIVVDRRAGTIEIDHQWLSTYETWGIVQAASQHMDMEPVYGTSVQDMDDDDD